MQHTLARGETIAIQEYGLRYDDFIRAQAVDGRMMNITPVTLFRNGASIATLRPRIDDYAQMPMTIAGAHSTLERDFYVLLIGGDHERATFRIYINPLVNLVWWGGILLIIGTVIATYPKALPARQAPKRERTSSNRPIPQPLPPQGGKGASSRN